jgi:hypothetical protein
LITIHENGRNFDSPFQANFTYFRTLFYPGDNVIFQPTGAGNLPMMIHMLVGTIAETPGLKYWSVSMNSTW